MTLKQRIRRDARRVAGDAEVATLLACLAEHLFNPNLDAHFIGKVCGASREVRRRLASVVGPLKTYITELRMMEAARLVRDTDLPIPEIGKRLGYQVARTFRRAFKECHRLTPAEMRKQPPADPPPDPVVAAAGALDGLDVEGDTGAQQRPWTQRLTPTAMAARLRRRSALGLLGSADGGELRDRLRRRHPGLEAATAEAQAPSGQASTAPAHYPLLLAPSHPRLEMIAAGAVFGRIILLPDADLRHAMLDGVRFGTSNAFDALQQLCQGQVQWDPKRAVTVAELGVQLLQTHRHIMGDESDTWLALAWVFLARVQMMAGDFGAAERALGFAWEEIPEGAELPPWAEVEVRRVEGRIRMQQARGGEAARAFDRAVELSHDLGRSDPNRLHALVERLELASFLGDAESALPLCDALEELTRTTAPDADRAALWRGCVSYHRGKVYAVAGRDAQAETCLLQAAALLTPGRAMPDQVTPDQVTPDLEAAATEAEAALLGSFVLHELARLGGRAGRLDAYDLLLRGVLERYQRLQTPMLEAAAEAELAALCALRGRPDEARRLAASAADFLDALPSHRRAWSAARRLRALANGGAEAPAPELEKTLAALAAELDSVRWEITGAQAAPAALARRQRA